MLEINKIHLGNNIDLCKQISDNVIDLTVTSPPYSKIRDYNGYSFDFPNLAKELYRITKPGGMVVWVVNDQYENGSRNLDSFKQAIYFKEECGFNINDVMIYEKPGMRYPSPIRYHQIYEFMHILSKGRPKTINFLKDRKNIYAGQKNARQNANRQIDGTLTPNSAWKLDPNRRIAEYGRRNNIWKYNVGKGHMTKDEIAYKHPAIFPEKLAADHIMSWSNENDIILDPFCGSGTTVKMAKQLKRNFIGMEISQEYCNIANERLNLCQTQESSVVS
jgi:DNA modification methylase